VQDPTFVKQCIAFQVFENAGLNVPWCNYAHVTVNGRDLGLYVHVESMDRRWVRRTFEQDAGDLWEGELSDSAEPGVEWLEMTAREKDNSRIRRQMEARRELERRLEDKRLRDLVEDWAF